jgi:hypothetical protein
MSKYIVALLAVSVSILALACGGASEKPADAPGAAPSGEPAAPAPADAPSGTPAAEPAPPK